MHAVARLDEASPADGYADRVHNGGEYETTRPRTRDLELRELIAAFRKGSPADRAELNAALMDADSTALHRFARAAEECVRRRRPELLEEALAGMALEGGWPDWRDTLVTLSLLHHSARWESLA